MSRRGNAPGKELTTMTTVPRALAAALAIALTLGVSVPVASAATPGTPSFSTPWGLSQPASFVPLSTSGAVGSGVAATAGPCGTATGAYGQGAAGGTAAQVCMGTGLSFVGPAVGQIATVIGPTIIGPAVIGNVVVSAGNGAAG
jgi:hypothetical protein